MKNKLLLAAFVLCMGCAAVSAKDLKVLSIGNSFAVSVGSDLRQLVKSFPEHDLELTVAYIAGCTLDRHVQNIKSAEENPETGMYGIFFWSTATEAIAPKKYKSNLIDLLKKQRYDVVTIQQGSMKSWDWESYEPYAGELIAFIRQHQPDAEIVIQQTWSYRVDAEQYGKKFKFDQTGMYERLRDAYRNLAEKYKFRVIPVGDAVQLFRKYTPINYQPSPEPVEYPDLPSNAGDVVGSSYWMKTKQGPDRRKLKIDPYHLNKDGKYMQACLWFSVLHGEPIDKITWSPVNMPQRVAVLLRRCAKEALAAYPQVK